jgi:hypothetical protein
LLITQSSWLLTLSPNCQITIPKSFQSHTFAFRRGNLHPYLFSPFQGAQRYEVFCFVKPPSILHPTSRQGGQRYQVFDIHKYRPAPQPLCRFSKIKSDLPIKLTPLSSAPPPASPFQGAQRYEVFRFVKSFPLAPPLFSPSLEGRQSYELFGICKPPYSQRPIPRSGGAQRYEVFRFVKPPLYSASLFPREHKGTKILMLSRLFPFCCPARRLVKTLPD